MLLDGVLNNPMLNLGTGLLSASGYSTTPVTLGQAMASGVQSMQAGGRRKLGNDLIRNRLTQTKRRQDAEQGIRDLLSGGQAGTAEGQSKLMGLLAQVAPAQVAHGLLSTRAQRTPEKIAVAQYLYPNDPEKQREYIESLANGNQNDLILDQLRASSLLLQNQQTMAELDKDKAEKLQKENDVIKGQATIKDNFVNTVSSGKKMLDALDVMEGTQLETGQSFMDVRPKIMRGQVTIKELFGNDASKERRMLTAYNSFNKSANDFALKLFDSLESQTNATFGVLRESIANIGVDPTTNRSIIGEALVQAKQVIDREKIKIPKSTEEMLERLIKRIADHQGVGLPPSGEDVDAEVSYGDL